MDTIKKKWKSLRDTFDNELKKVPEPRSGDPGPSNYRMYSAWPHSESMFIKHQGKPRKAGGITINNGDDSDENDIPSQEAKKNIKRGAQQLINIEVRELKLFENKVNNATNNDEDEAFFKSLLPHVRKLRSEEKLDFRMDAQKLTLTYLYNKNRFLNDPNINNLLPTPTTSK